LRIFERRAVLISVRRAILRVALRAELVLAMPVLVLAAACATRSLDIANASGGECLAATARRL
jgi:hypothetical protein